MSVCFDDRIYEIILNFTVRILLLLSTTECPSTQTAEQQK